ncbi:DUF3081 domain-containing protein [Vibrio kagoshimensis]|uniref:DUF3081 domain-containing protein n=1 Tax=Vibrio kagoshimensis TaxID=2910244 RepID=UPI003D234C5C
MDKKLTIKEFLRVFDCIRASGDRLDDRYVLDEVYAWHDYDGYTCWLSYKDVTVTLMFHGTLKIEHGKPSNYSAFISHCLAMITTKPIH